MAACIVGFLLYHSADIARNVGGMWDNLQKMGFCGTGCTRILYAPAYMGLLNNGLGAVSNTDPIHKGVC